MQALMEGMLGLMRFDIPVNKDVDVKALAQARYGVSGKSLLQRKPLLHTSAASGGEIR
jgi:hypothetical protein